MYTSRPAHVQQIGAGAAFTLSGTGAFAYTWNFLEPAVIRQLAIKVTTTLSSSALTVVTFYARPTYGSATNQVTLGTVSLGDTQAANSLVVNNITPVKVPAGYQVVADCTTAATSSGAGIAYIAHEYSPETLLNDSAVTIVTA